MAAINIGKVIAGGLLAGLVANAFDFVINTYVMMADWQAWASAHNLDPAAMNSPGVAGTWVAIDFLYGILIVWTYAAIRPRFGPGVKTALYAGFLLYVAITLVVFGFTMMGMLTMAMFVKGSLAGIVSTGAASIAGAWVYTEAGAPSAVYAR
jgi:hypothetical protein